MFLKRKIYPLDREFIFGILVTALEELESKAQKCTFCDSFKTAYQQMRSVTYDDDLRFASDFVLMFYDWYDDLQDTCSGVPCGAATDIFRGMLDSIRSGVKIDRESIKTEAASCIDQYPFRTAKFLQGRLGPVCSR